MPVPLTSRWITSIGIALTLAGVAASHASVLYTADGFEPVDFNTGVLPGQDGWVQLGATNSAAAVHDAGSGNPIATGTQAVTLTRDGDDQASAAYFNVPLSPGFQAPFATVSWDMYVPENTSPVEYGPGFSIEAYSTGTQRIAAVGMDAADGSLYQVVNNTPSTPSFTLTPQVQLNQWQNWKLILDFVNEIYYLDIDGNRIVNGSPLLEDISYAPSGGDHLIDASITLHPTDTNFFGVDGEAFIDNYYIIDTAVLPITGDYNASGQVEQGDLDLVLQNWGSSAAPVPVGWINDLPTGVIDQDELDGVLQNWGALSTPAFAGSVVPEPAGATVLAVAGILCGVARRRPHISQFDQLVAER